MFVKDWNIKKCCGYQPLTDIYRRLSCKEYDGVFLLMEFIEKTFEEVKKNYKILTEFIMALNWKSFEHSDDNLSLLGNMYVKYWKKYDNYAVNNLKDQELSYYYKTID